MSRFPPPNPADVWTDAPPSSSPPVGRQLALYSDRIINWVNRRRWWATVLLWLVGYVVLLPLLVIAKTRGSRNGMFGAAALFVAILVVVAASETPEPVDTLAASQEAQEDTAAATGAGQDAESADAAAPSPSPSPSPSHEPSPRPSPSPSPEAASTSPRDDDAPVVAQGQVVDIVDGDTLELSDGTRVRMAIADTPEVHGGLETCGPEANDFAGDFLAGETVAVYRPAGAPEYDSFGRLLGEVVRVSDGASFNVAMVAAGLATVDQRFTSEDPDLTIRLEDAAADAITASCVDQSPPEPEPEPEPAPEPEPEPSCDPNYSGACVPIASDVDCAGGSGNGPEYVNGPVTVVGSDIYDLDGDGDGIGCE